MCTHYIYIYNDIYNTNMTTIANKSGGSKRVVMLLHRGKHKIDWSFQWCMVYFLG